MVFINNKYTRWYNHIIASGKERMVTTDYTETHHIIPKSLGGSNNTKNLVVLTAREHFICHLLLPKMTAGKDKYKMVFALQAMVFLNNDHQHRYKVTNRVYETLKRQVSALRKGVPASVNAKMKNSESHKRLRASGFTTAGMTGRTHSEETKYKMRMAQLRRDTMSDKTKAKISESLLGRFTGLDNVMSIAAVKEKHLAACIERSAIKKECPYCQSLFSRNTFARWHGDNCKLAR
jgi:hypothetical protein